MADGKVKDYEAILDNDTPGPDVGADSGNDPVGHSDSVTDPVGESERPLENLE